MTRTSQKLPWLKDDDFKKWCAEAVEKYARVYYVRVSAFAFMDNHEHIAITLYKPERMDIDDVRRRFELYQETLKYPQKWDKNNAKKYFKRFTNLSMFMWEINLRIACEHNRRYEGWGHFWGARFKSILLETDEDLMRVCQYIEANRVKSGQVEKPSDYAYCSAGKLARELECGETPELDPISWLANYKPQDRAKAYVMTNDYLAWIYNNPDKRYEPKPPEFAWLDLTNLNLDKYEQDLVRGAFTNWGIGVYGSDDFIEKITGIRPQPAKGPPDESS